MLDSKIIELLNYRVEQEQLSSRIYEQMSMFLGNKGYVNTAKLYAKYASEELGHAEWAKTYLLSYNIEPELHPLPAPSTEYSTLQEVLDLTLEHEMDITKQCNELARIAQEMAYFTCFDLALKYCREQVEEIDKAYTLKDMYALSNNDLLFDHAVEDLI